MAGFAGFDGDDVIAENVTVRGTLSVTDDVTLTGDQSVDDLEINGALNHDGTTAGFYGVTPATRPSAYTQTYATANKTHANPTAAALTDSTGQTPDTTIENVPDAVAATTDISAAQLTSVNASFLAIEKNISDLADQVTKLVADVADSKQLSNSMIDDLQALGIFQ